MTEAEIFAAIETHYNKPFATRWVVLRNVRTETGYTYSGSAIAQFFHDCDPLTPRYIDALAINLHPSRHFQRVAFEIKVSRSDFLVELAEPMKSAKARAIADRFYFAMPAGIYDSTKDNERLAALGAGVCEVHLETTVHGVFSDMSVARRAVKHEHVWPIPEAMIMSIIRNAARVPSED